MSVPPKLIRTASTFVTLDARDDIEKHYILGHQLGQAGQFGHALLATHRQTGEKRAVKVISKSKFSRASDRKLHFAELRNEIDVMRRMDHPNIIKLYDVYETANELYIVMEAMMGGELFDRIKEQPDGNYSEADAASVLRQIAEGLKYMHEHKIAHCDLKPDNFLFKDNSKDAALKIIDFGMSKWVKRRKYFKSLRGTPYYIAPEVIQGRYTEHCDMWSVGVVMFVMLFGYPPFHAESDSDIFRLILAGFDPVTKKGYKAHFPQDIPASDQAKDLMSKLLTSDTAARLTAAEMLEHPWLTGGASKTPLYKSVLNNLKDFTATSKFKTGILRIMAESMSDAELEHLRKVFKELDEDGNGKITVTELSHAMEKAGTVARKEELLALLKAADVDGDGTLSYEELLLTSVGRKLSAKEERLWSAFSKVDLNRDGKLSAQEIQQVLGGNMEEVEAMIAEVDTDGNKVIDFDEFITMWSLKEENANSKDVAAK